MVAAGNTKVSFFLRVVWTVAVGRGGLLCEGSTRCQQQNKKEELFQGNYLYRLEK